jgi:hypothetical protein
LTGTGFFAFLLLQQEVPPRVSILCFLLRKKVFQGMGGL